MGDNGEDINKCFESTNGNDNYYIDENGNLQFNDEEEN